MAEIVAAPAHSGVAAAPPYHRSSYRWYVTGLMTFIYACHSMDRGLPNILVEPVRHEFNLTDSQLGLYTGVAFGLAFCIAVLPLGHVSDRVNRRNFLAVILLLWSVLTTAGGFARNFVQLLLLRFGVGAAEAGCAPVTLPFIASIMPSTQRSLAMGVVYMGAPLGTLLATLGGGYVAEHHGWRAALLLAGIPGLILAALLLLTVREPQREQAGEGAPAPKFTEVLGFLWRKTPLVSLIAGCSFLSLMLTATHVWASSFFIRVHHLSLTEVGLILGLGGGVLSLIANPLWGWLGGALSQRARHWPLTLVWVNTLIVIALSLVMLFTASTGVAIACFVASGLLLGGYPPMTYAVILDETPERMRGTVMSIVQWGANILGYAVGPVLIGAMSDIFGGGTAIRYAMANSLVIYLFAAALVWYAATNMFRPAKA